MDKPCNWRPSLWGSTRLCDPTFWTLVGHQKTPWRRHCQTPSDTLEWTVWRAQKFWSYIWMLQLSTEKHWKWLGSPLVLEQGQLQRYDLLVWLVLQLPWALPPRSPCGVQVQAHQRQLLSVVFQLSKQFSPLELHLYIWSSNGVDTWTFWLLRPPNQFPDCAFIAKSVQGWASACLSQWRWIVSTLNDSNISRWDPPLQW